MDRAGVINLKARKRMEPFAFPGDNAPPVIASTAYVVIPRAVRLAWLVLRPKKAADPTAFVATSVQSSIQMSNAMVANATAKVFADSTTALRVHRPDNVSRTTASTAFAAATSARELVKRVPMPRKAAALTEYARRLPTRPIPTMNAIPANAMAPMLAINLKPKNRTARRVRSPRNAFRVSV